MRDLSLACSLALALSSGCYASHGRGSLDGGSDPIDARPGVDAPLDGSWRRDARPACTEGDRCDDGDACTTDDRCRDGECAGMPRACATPPSACFAPLGACVAGECAYELAEGALCDDADPCTVGDACAGGVCDGEPLACDAPPSPVCVGEDTLRTFEARGACDATSCTYAHADQACPGGGCVDGLCRCMPSPWAVTVVHTPRNGGGGPGSDAIAIDGSGGVHVVYQVRMLGDAMIMHYAHLPPGGVWHTEALGAGRTGTIAIDPAGAVHIVYVDLPTTGITHLERAPGASWARSTVPIGDMPLFVSTYVVMAIDDVGVVHVAFGDIADTLVHVSRSTTGVWSAAELTVRGTRYPSAAAIDPSRGLHISYTRHDQEHHHAYRSPTGSWSFSATGLSGTNMSDIAIDRAGGTHMLGTTRIWAHGTHAPVAHAYLASPGGAWVLETVDTAPGYGVSTAIDASGVIHAVFLVGGPGDWRVRHAWRDESGVWSSEAVPATILNGWSMPTSLAADRDGGLHLVLSTDEHTLVYAHRRMCP